MARKGGVASNIKYSLTDERRAYLLAHYRQKAGDKARIARALLVPQWKVERWVTQLGLGTPHRPWTAEEDRYLEEQLPHVSYLDLASHLGRTVKAVQTHAWELGIRKTSEGYTVQDLFLMFGVYHARVLQWIERGWLQGTRRHSARTASQHGDWWLFTPQQVREFLRQHPQAVDPQKFDWLAVHDIVFGGEYGLGELAPPTEKAS